MLQFLKMKIIFGIAVCLVAIVSLDSRVDAYAVNYRHSSSSEESLSEEENGWDRDRDWNRDRDWDKDWNRDRDWDKDWNRDRDRDWDRNRDRDKNKNKKNFVCPSSYGTFADVEDCSSYFVCQKWKSKWRSCQRNKRFDRYRRTCLPYIIAVCDDGKDDKEPTKGDFGTTTPQENSFTCPSFMGTFPHPDDCSKYYDCSFYVPSLKTCPKKKLFDGVKKKCKSEQDVNCGSRKKPGETTLGTTPIPTRPEPSTPRSSPPTPSTPRSSSRPTPPTPRSSSPQTPSTPRSSPRPTPPTPRSSSPRTPSTPRPTPPTPSTPITLSPTTPRRITPPTPKPTTTPGTTPEPTGPPETDCDEDDLDCIIKETGETPTWFKCPEAVGAFRHPSSNKLFIFCMNWKPNVKKCGQNLLYSDELRTCITS